MISEARSMAYRAQENFLDSVHDEFGRSFAHEVFEPLVSLNDLLDQLDDMIEKELLAIGQLFQEAQAIERECLE